MEKIKTQGSAFLAYIEYEIEKETLFLIFKNGKKWQYPKFDNNEWLKLKHAPNKGGYVTAHILNKNTFQGEYLGIVPPNVFNKNNTTRNYYKYDH